MKTLRVVLITLGGAAVILLGLHQVGSTPISKGYDTGFRSTIQNSPDVRLALSTDTGDLTCWVRLRVPSTAQVFSAKLSNGTPLLVYQDAREGSDQWLAIVTPGQTPQEKFKWPSGTALFVSSNDKSAGSLTVSDWQIFLNDKDYDSKDRARWRMWLFRLSLGVLGLALIGGGLQAYSALSTSAPPLTPQRCIEELINSTEGATSQETQWMRSILTKVLLGGVPVAAALASIPLTNVQQKMLWFKLRSQFRSRLEWLIVELNRYLSYV